MKLTNQDVRPLVEERDLVIIISPPTSTVCSSQRGKTKSRQQCGGGPNFKRFRKNLVLYGPRFDKSKKKIHLEVFDQEECERVLAMKREEKEAEAYERQADLLFNDTSQAKKLKPARKTTSTTAGRRGRRK